MRRASAGLLLLLAAMQAACGAEAQSRRRGTGAVGPRALYPMAVGNAWSYDVETESPDAPTLLVNRVTSVDGRLVTMETGQQPIVYELRPDGIFWPAKGGYLLREPIERGASWGMRSGSTVRILSVSRTCEGGGRNFRDCVEVLLESPEQRVRTVYAPGVGPVLLEVELHLPDLEYGFKARLRGYVVEPEGP